MVPAIHARRGRCPHRPETWRAGPAGINLPLCSRTFGPMKGIGPYADGMILPCDQVRPNISGVPSTPAAAAAPSPSRRGQGIRRMRGGSWSVLRPAPHPSRALPGPPSPRRGFFATSGGGMIPAPYFRRGVTIPALSGLFPGFPRLRRNN